jgi:hypothetical protein
MVIEIADYLTVDMYITNITSIGNQVFQEVKENPKEVEEVLVTNYYWEIYNHHLKFSNAPALDVDSKKKLIYIPMRPPLEFIGY